MQVCCWRQTGKTTKCSTGKEEIDLDREVIRNPFHDSKETLEKTVLSRQMAAQLREAVSQLRPAERRLLFQLYCEKHTERALTKQRGVCCNAIHKKKVRILKTKKFSELVKNRVCSGLDFSFNTSIDTELAAPAKNTIEAQHGRFNLES